MLHIYTITLLWMGSFTCISIETVQGTTNLTSHPNNIHSNWDVAHEERPGRGSNQGPSAELTNVELDALTNH